MEIDSFSVFCSQDRKRKRWSNQVRRLSPGDDRGRVVIHMIGECIVEFPFVLQDRTENSVLTSHIADGRTALLART